MGKMSKRDWLKQNVEAVMCFTLVGILVGVGIHSMGAGRKKTVGEKLSDLDERRQVQKMELSSGKVIILREQKTFLGLLIPRPISHYSLIVMRNPFAPIPGFNPPQDVIPPDKLQPLLVPEDLVLIAPPALSKDGKWLARLQNLKTGEVYLKTEGEEIAEVFKVKKIRKDLVILTRDGKDIEYTPPPAQLSEPTVALALNGTIHLPEQGKWVAQIENLRTGEIYFKREGDKIAEIFEVKKIERSKVILSREGKEDIELKLGRGK